MDSLHTYVCSAFELLKRMALIKTYNSASFASRYYVVLPCDHVDVALRSYLYETDAFRGSPDPPVYRSRRNGNSLFRAVSFALSRLVSHEDETPSR